MTEIYYIVDDVLKTRPALGRWRRSPHVVPRCSDAEVVTIALLQGVFEVATLKQTYRLVAQNWRAAFPYLPSFKQWLARVHQLLPHVSGLLATTCTHPPPAARPVPS